MLIPVIPDPHVGSVLDGKYEITSVVGRGGMSVVYRARNVYTQQIVAVKMLKQELVEDAELTARFSREASAGIKMVHVNIIGMHEVGTARSGQPYIVMDFLEGETLLKVLKKEGRVGVKRCVKILTQVCEAVAHMHNQKIIHRDIKPGNIMLVETANDTDVVKMFDLGFAKIRAEPGTNRGDLTQFGDVLGTPLYMSPEQTQGHPLDSRSDIYSIGCVMYEMLCGSAPLVGSSVLETMQMQVKEKPKALDETRPDLYIPEQLSNIAFQAMEKDPDARYQSVSDLKRDLESVALSLSGKMTSSVTLPGISKLKQLPPERPKPPIPIIIIGLLLACIIFFVVFSQHH